MERKRILGIVLDILKAHMNYYFKNNSTEITEYTCVDDLPFDDFDKTLLVLRFENEFSVGMDKDDCFTDNTRICNIVDYIEQALNKSISCTPSLMFPKTKRFDKVIKDVRTLAEAIYERNDKAGLYEETSVNRNLQNIEQEIRDIEKWLNEETD